MAGIWACFSTEVPYELEGGRRRLSTRMIVLLATVVVSLLALIGTVVALFVSTAESKPIIYFATWGGGIKAYSGSQVRTIVNSNESCYAVTYDSIQKKIYWSTYEQSKTYRANVDGSDVEIILNLNKNESIHALAFDWLSGSIYMGTDNGTIYACDTRPAQPFTCFPVLTGEELVRGIALNPVGGTMFWTAHSFQHISFIKTAGMDGSNKSTIFTGSDYPEGIAIDFKMSRIYWTATLTGKIQSSNLDGSDRRTIAQLSHYARPVGIALFGGTMFCGDSGNMKLESWSKVGNKLQTLHNDTNRIGHLAVASDLELPKTRINHCEGHKCSEVCVLTPTSFKCLN